MTCFLAACGVRSAGTDSRLAASDQARGSLQESTPVQPDASAVHARDTWSDNPMAMDHSETPADREMTGRIRREVMADGSLSMAAYNVTIITTDGRVMLRGPVASETERLYIQEKANNVAGAANVDNRLVIRQ
jgi:osmotically-inducible protein OsmY